MSETRVNPDTFLTTEELAARWRIEERSVGATIRRGDLVATKIGGRWLAKVSDVEAFEQARANIQRSVKRTRRPRARTTR